MRLVHPRSLAASPPRRLATGISTREKRPFPLPHIRHRALQVTLLGCRKPLREILEVGGKGVSFVNSAATTFPSLLDWEGGAAPCNDLEALDEVRGPLTARVLPLGPEPRFVQRQHTTTRAVT